MWYAFLQNTGIALFIIALIFFRNKISTRGLGYILMLGAVICGYGVFHLITGTPENPEGRFYVGVVALLFTALFSFSNRHAFPIFGIFICTGGFLNKLVVAANNFKMPYAEEIAPYVSSIFHAPITEKSRLVFLSDWIPINDGGAASWGDICITLSFYIAVIEILQYLHAHRPSLSP